MQMNKNTFYVVVSLEVEQLVLLLLLSITTILL